MTQDLDTLRIDKGATNLVPVANRRLWQVAGIAGAVMFLLILFLYFQNKAVTVETTTVTKLYPSQSFTLLNASGYVVARRKAAVAAKTTGRLEWLGVEEGSRVTAGEVVARLENRDLTALLDQASAAVLTAASAVEQARAEQADATGSFERQKELLKQGIVAKADYDVAETRFRRAVAAVSGATASLRASEASRRGAEVALDYSFIRAPFNAVVLTKGVGNY